MFKSAVFALVIASASASFEKIKNFTPRTSVTDHAGVSKDQTAMEALAAGKTQKSFDEAELVWSEGGNSKTIATLSVPGGLPVAVSAKTKVTAKGLDGRTVVGIASSAAVAGANTLFFQYSVTDDFDNHLDCRVGGLPENERVTEGCLVADGTLNIDNVADAVTYSYVVETDNNNGRTLKGFSTGANTKMRPGDNTGAEYFSDFQKFFDYYGAFNYADQIVSAAFDGTDANMANGDILIQSNGLGFEGRLEILKKGSAYLSVAMYVIRELEDAIYDCDTKCKIGECNDDSAVHALDEAVAFYYGADDNFLHALANKRCQNFGTCAGDNAVEGDAAANAQVFAFFGKMQKALLSGDCDSARPVVGEIARQIWISLIQGTLRYAWELDTTNNPAAQVTEKAAAEGAIFAASVLPIIHACDPNQATTIYDNMKIQSQANTDFVAVRRAFEACYKNLGIKCKDIGGVVNSAGTNYDSALTRPCGDFDVFSSASTVTVGSLVGASVLAAVAFLM